jgi:threonine aldolase
MSIIDLRSDTVTQPTPAMREAMATAMVGDDVYGEDPTVNRLQEMAAEHMGQEAGLFVASGTMGNLAAMLAHCQRGDEAILGKWAHTFLFEAGGISALGGIHSCQLPNQADGSLNLEEIEDAIRWNDAHEPVTRLVALENTHNRCGGTVLDAAYTRAVAELAHRHGISLHIDGARIFNAAAALGVPAKELTSAADSVTFCLSKGLCAPAGSVLCGSKAFIQKAHRARKILGGGMRQAGILAAAGIVALESMVERLAEDHARARTLAQGLSTIQGITLDPGSPHTNMVFWSLTPEVPVESGEIVRRLKDKGIRIGDVGNRRFRMVTHYWIGDQDIDDVRVAIRDVMGSI